MASKERIFFPQGINMYVPNLQAASDLLLGQPTLFSLGKPAAVSANLFVAAGAANAVAGTAILSASAAVSDSVYGRTLRLTPSGDPGNAFAIDVYGTDYLGQPMIERFTGANGSTGIIYGKKAFYRVTQTKIVTAATNAITFNLGTGFRLGLPYKTDINWAKENGVYVNVWKRDTYFWRNRAGLSAASLAIAGGSVWVRAQFPGFVKTVFGQPDSGGGGANPVLTVKLATVAITGLTCTLTDNDATGLFASGTPTTPGYNANNRFIANSNIEIVATAAAAAAGDAVGVELTPTQFLPADLTDPATVTTADPRGTYEALAVYDGAKEIIVGLMPDAAVSTLGNGGLFGIKHFFA